MPDFRTVSESQTDRTRWCLYKTSAHKQVKLPAIKLEPLFLRVKQGGTLTMRASALYSVKESSGSKEAGKRSTTTQHSTVHIFPMKQTPHPHLRIQLAIHTPHTPSETIEKVSHTTPPASHNPISTHTTVKHAISSHQKTQNAALLLHPQRARTLYTQTHPLTLE